MANMALAIVLTTTFYAISNAYNPKDGMALAQLEQAANCGEDRFNSWNVGNQSYSVDKTKLRFIKGTKGKKVLANAGVGSLKDPDGCFVAVQGTKNAAQSMEDADFVTQDFKPAYSDSCADCRISSGWAAGYETIRKGVFGALEDFGCQHKPLYLTGHSLGSAILHYILYDAIEANYTMAHVMAMESPRPGNKKFAASLQANIQKAGVKDAYRVTHYQDIVPHLPPYGLAGYTHALPEIYYTNRSGSDYQDCGLDDETSKCSNQWHFWRLTGNDHCWYADINPCSCSASTSESNVTEEEEETVSVMV